jgi:hypothetical protein
MVPIGRWGTEHDRGYEAMNIICKGQIRWVARNDVVGQIRFIERMFGIAA